MTEPPEVMPLIAGNFRAETSARQMGNDYMNAVARIIDGLVKRDDLGKPTLGNNIPLTTTYGVQLRRRSANEKVEKQRQVRNSLRVFFGGHATSSAFRFFELEYVRPKGADAFDHVGDSLTVKLFRNAERRKQADVLYVADNRMASHTLQLTGQSQPLTLLDSEAMLKFGEIGTEAQGVFDNITDSFRMTETAAERKLIELTEFNTLMSMGVEPTPPRDPHDWRANIMLDSWLRFKEATRIPERQT